MAKIYTKAITILMNDAAKTSFTIAADTGSVFDQITDGKPFIVFPVDGTENEQKFIFKSNILSIDVVSNAADKEADKDSVCNE